VPADLNTRRRRSHLVICHAGHRQRSQRWKLQPYSVPAYHQFKTRVSNRRWDAPSRTCGGCYELGRPSLARWALRCAPATAEEIEPVMGAKPGSSRCTVRSTINNPSSLAGIFADQAILRLIGNAPPAQPGRFSTCATSPSCAISRSRLLAISAAFGRVSPTQESASPQGPPRHRGRPHLQARHQVISETTARFTPTTRSTPTRW